MRDTAQPIKSVLGWAIRANTSQRDVWARDHTLADESTSNIAVCFRWASYPALPAQMACAIRPDRGVC